MAAGSAIMDDEEAQQRVTFLLQEIDANICAAHRSATQICATVRRHHQVLKQIHEATQVWRPLFESFQAPQPARKTPSRTRSGSVRSAKKAATEGADQTDHEGTADGAVSDAGTAQKERLCRQYLEDFNENAVDELIRREKNDFKTTKLRNIDDSVDESFNISMGSENLPDMSRTPYLKTPAFRYPGEPSQSSMISEERMNWSPAMSSPLRTGVIQEEQRETPASVISSVACESPGVSKNLMKVGAFEYTPKPQEKGSRGAAAGAPDQTPATPDMPRFATISSPATIHPGDLSPIQEHADTDAETKDSHNPPEALAAMHTPQSKRTPQQPPASASSSLSSWRSPSEHLSGLRRKYALESHTTPDRRRETRVSVGSVGSTGKKQRLDSDEPLTPNFDMASPLLSTRLKAMTPRTPLSNRLVGANLDVGSISQESRLQEYENSFDAGEPAPEFQLSLFPEAFQRGIGAVQISSLYSKFHGTDDGDYPAYNVEQLQQMLENYGPEKIEVLLDTLVSRRLLRPFVVEGTMFWQIPK